MAIIPLGYSGFWKAFATASVRSAQEKSKEVMTIRESTAAITAIGEGMMFDNTRLRLTSVKPRLVGENSSRFDNTPIKDQPPIMYKRLDNGTG